jgi:hypothetical protein
MPIMWAHLFLMSNKVNWRAWLVYFSILWQKEYRTENWELTVSKKSWILWILHLKTNFWSLTLALKNWELIITEQKGRFCGFYTSKRAFLDSNNYFACAKLKVELEKRWKPESIQAKVLPDFCEINSPDAKNAKMYILIEKIECSTGFRVSWWTFDINQIVMKWTI